MAAFSRGFQRMTDCHNPRMGFTGTHQYSAPTPMGKLDQKLPAEWHQRLALEPSIKMRTARYRDDFVEYCLAIVGHLDFIADTLVEHGVSNRGQVGDNA